MVDPMVVAAGNALVVRCMKYRGRYPADEFIRGADPQVRTRFLVLAKRMAEYGQLINETHGRWLKGEFSVLFEFKPRDGRVFAFLHGTSLYLTNGAQKNPKNQEPDYREAMRTRDDFFARVQHDTEEAQTRALRLSE